MGWSLYVDNYYTTMKMVEKLHDKNKWISAGGTTVLTKRKSGADTADDSPFPKLSNGAVKKFKRGWWHHETQYIKHQNGDYVIQGTVKKDQILYKKVSVAVEKITATQLIEYSYSY